jgi:hypothetical protein
MGEVTMHATARRAWMALIVLLLAFGNASAASLNWEIERNFRYFRYNSDVALQRVAFDMFVGEHNTKPDPAELEKFLNGTAFWTKKLSVAGTARDAWPAAWRKPDLDTPLELIAELRKAEGSRSNVPEAHTLTRLGWSSLLVRPPSQGARDGQTDTCWSPVRRMHSNCSVYGDYARPRGWIVRVFDPAAAGEAKCAWRADGGADAGDMSEAAIHAAKGPHTKVGPWQSAANRSCREARIYVPSDIANARKVKGAVKIVRRAADGTETEVVVSPQDTLIVGFADSFGSGEGNPERGAQFFQFNEAIPNTGLPGRRSPDAAHLADRAQWTDRWCHRSVYSWQIRTALHLSQTDRQKSVTVLPYGCSGAEVFEGILYNYDGVEFTSKPVGAVGHPAQLGLAYQELCKTYYKFDKAPAIVEQPRWQDDTTLRRAAKNGQTIDFSAARKNEILDYVGKNITRCEKSGPGQFEFKRDVDSLLMVAGINDIGFSRWVAAAITDGKVAEIANGFIPKAGDPETEMRLQRLKFRYTIFREALDKRFLIDAGLVSGAAAGVLPKVLTPLYPRGLEDESGDICANGNQGMTAGTFPNRLFPLDGVESARKCVRTGVLGFKSGVFSLIGAQGPVLAIRKTSDMKAIEAFRAGQLNGGVVEFSAPSSSGPGYTVVDTPTAPNGAFAKRGFCATKDAASAIPDGGRCIAFEHFLTAPPPSCLTNSDNCIPRSAESLHVARAAMSTMGSTPPEWIGAWRPFGVDGRSMNNFYPYAPRTRLYRTPNDVYVLINQRPSQALDTTMPGILDINGRTTGGAFHPTAEGHALIAAMMMKHVTPP